MKVLKFISTLHENFAISASGYYNHALPLELFLKLEHTVLQHHKRQPEGL